MCHAVRKSRSGSSGSATTFELRLICFFAAFAIVAPAIRAVRAVVWPFFGAAALVDHHTRRALVQIDVDDPRSKP